MKRYGVLMSALVSSCGIHVAIAGGWPDKTVIVSGGEMAGEVALGTSFADLVAGTLESTAADGKITPATAAPVQTIRPAETKPAETTPVETPPQTVQPAAPTLTAPSVDRVQQPTTQVSAAASPLAVIAPSQARAAVSVTSSIRPITRPAPKPTEPEQAEPEQARRGNAQVSAAAGQQTGRQGGTVAQSSGAQQSTARQVGQGEIDSYKSRVASRVIRVAERMRSRGTQGSVVVGMQIAANGTLARATVSQSSGNAEADAIAVAAIQRAAPFDPTPNGQSLSVAFRVQLISR